jgi:predicted N-acetyltransferase YhbS
VSDPRIRAMRPADETFVSTCSHIDESEENDACAVDRAALLRALIAEGADVEVALVDDRPVGFAHGVPIERSSWGPAGEGLFVLPCLFVVGSAAGSGIGRRLVEAIETAARRRGRQGVVVVGYTYGGDAAWFMPAGYFEHLGYRIVERRPPETLLWKPFAETASPPSLFRPAYQYEPAAGRAVVDLFWNAFCPTSAIEARRVREVCAEFGGDVVLRERCAEDRPCLVRHQISRGIYVNGREIGWGYEAPRDGIRRAIAEALEND